MTDPASDETTDSETSSEPTDSEPTDSEPGGESAPQAVEPVRTRPALLSWLLPALAVILLLVAGVLGGLLYRQHGKQAARDAAVTAARQVLINAYSIDYRSVTSDYQRFLAGTSGELHSELASGKSKFIQTVQTTHTHETAQIVDAGLVRSGANSATVTVALNSPLTTTSITKPQTRSYRTEVDVARVNGTWLATAIRQVS